MKTFSAKAQEVQRDWYVVDGTDQVLGRLAAEIARRLRGKHKPEFTPHVDTGDYITIHGVPEISMSTGPEIAGGKATAGIAVNTIPRIFAATPGLKRIIDLPSPTALMGPEAYERR